MTWPRVALFLAAAIVLAGCGAGRPDEPAPPSPTRTIPPPTLSPATTLVSGLPRHVGNEGSYQVFEVTPQQRELVARNWYNVIVRRRLWNRGVRFGITDPFKPRHLVLIDPGLSGLTAREILDRMLRDG